jgi:hypothetical protein
MKIQDLEEIAPTLRLTKQHLFERTRNKYVYSKTKGRRVGDYKIFVPDLERVDKVKYNKYQYECRLPEMGEYECLKITKADYASLLSLGAKEL